MNILQRIPLSNPTPFNRRTCLMAMALIVLFSLSQPVRAIAQEAAENATPSEEISAQAIEDAIKQVKESKDLDDATRSKVLETYNQALEALKRKQEYDAATLAPQDIIVNVQKSGDKNKAELDRITANPNVPVADLPAPETKNLPEQEQYLTSLENRLAELKKEFAQLEAEPKRRSARRKDIRNLLFSLSERRDELRRELEASPPSDEPPQLTAARRAALLARLAALKVERPALETELARYDAEDAEGLVRLRRDLLSQQVAAVERQVKSASDKINRLRQEEAEKLAREARQQLANSHPLLRPYAEKSSEWAETAKTIAEEIEIVDEQLKRIRNVHEGVAEDYRETTTKVETVGLTGPIGFRLRSKRASLPNLRQHRHNVQSRREILEKAQWEHLEYDDVRSDLANPEKIVQDILTEANGELSQQKREELQSTAREVVDTQRQNLDLLIRNYQIYLDTLEDLDLAERELIKNTETFASYIDENVLWIRSSKPLSFTDVHRDQNTLWDLFTPAPWLEVGAVLWTDVQGNPLPHTAALLLFGTLFYFGSQFRGELKEIGKQVERNTFYRILPTVRAVFLTAIISIFWPGLLLYVSWRLSLVETNAPFASSLSIALMSAAVTVLPLEFVRQSCRTRGLAESHFGWSRTAVRRLRNNLRILVGVGFPLMFVATMLHGVELEPRHDSLERITFILAMFVLAFSVHRILRPIGGVLDELMAYHRGGWIERLKYFWPAIGSLLPLFLAGLAAVGYYYTAVQFTWRLQATFWLLVSLLYVREFLLRWILVHRRKLSIKQARERRAAAEEQQQQAVMNESTVSAPRPPAEELAADLAAISSQTQKLIATGLLATLAVGLWLVWVDILPALNILDRWELWSVTVEEPIEPEAVDAAPAAASTTTPTSTAVSPIPAIETPADDGLRETRTVLKPITVANLAVAVLVGVLTYICARNIPGLLEMSLLPRLPLEASMRYAITRVASYIIVLVGIVVAFNSIGVSWSKIQWLATALTFGLAFGLQEIFANFVSGLIILFERPIRVGDIVTVDDITGVVSRVRIRATTITNWDRKEFVVPNREFITGRVLNWTLSDSTNRLLVNVGIAYGSDTERARNLLLKIAQENPIVLDDPAPIATFEGFGDSTLNLVLRVFLPSMDNRLPVIHELHTAIDKAFRDAEIEIAFPQRDLHVRSVPEAWSRNQTLPSEPVGTNANGANGHA